jgi:ParB-like chromosome segregation protein Spo0J
VKVIELKPDELVVSDELRRSGSAKQFEERLQASIEEIGLSEPIKVAPMPSGQYLVVDGTMRLRALQAIRKKDPEAFITIPAYVTEYERRYEIRYQTDIYQDLLPSQLAALVEHLHKTEGVKKIDIARYIGVSPATLRNYTGVGRLMRRTGLFPSVVELMDLGVLPASNPFAWQRLTVAGLHRVLEDQFADEGETAETWCERTIAAARRGQVVRYVITTVEALTGSLEKTTENYRQDEDVRSAKRDYGLRRAGQHETDTHQMPGISPAGQQETMTFPPNRDVSAAVRNLKIVERDSRSPVLKSAARSFKAYLK